MHYKMSILPQPQNVTLFEERVIRGNQVKQVNEAAP